MGLKNYSRAIPAAKRKELDLPKNSRIYFSSEGMQGAWDIATMSMRGIKSCMRWSHGNALSLIGSIIDPCCGIVYVSDGKRTKYGSKMLIRSVVRLIVRDYDKKPSLFIEEQYAPIERDISSSEWKELIEWFFNTKTKGKYSLSSYNEDYVIPRTKQVDDLDDIENICTQKKNPKHKCNPYDFPEDCTPEWEEYIRGNYKPASSYEGYEYLSYTDANLKYRHRLQKSSLLKGFV
jgi:hypothetical protein